MNCVLEKDCDLSSPSIMGFVPLSWNEPHSQTHSSTNMFFNNTVFVLRASMESSAGR